MLHGIMVSRRRQHRAPEEAAAFPGNQDAGSCVVGTDVRFHPHDMDLECSVGVTLLAAPGSCGTRWLMPMRCTTLPTTCPATRPRRTIWCKRPLPGRSGLP